MVGETASVPGKAIQRQSKENEPSSPRAEEVKAGSQGVTLLPARGDRSSLPFPKEHPPPPEEGSSL